MKKKAYTLGVGKRPARVAGADYVSGVGAYVGEDVFRFVQEHKIEPYLVELIEYLSPTSSRSGCSRTHWDFTSCEIPFRCADGTGLMLQFSYGPRRKPVVRAKGVVAPLPPRFLYRPKVNPDGYDGFDYVELGDHWVYMSSVAADFLLRNIGASIYVAGACRKLVSEMVHHSRTQYVSTTSGDVTLEPDDSDEAPMTLCLTFTSDGEFFLFRYVDEPASEGESVEQSGLLWIDPASAGLN